MWGDITAALTLIFSMVFQESEIDMWGGMRLVSPQAG
ncbi:hypothetical protein IGK89_000822 [Enterococcus sp. DIV0007]|nr:hypothetical protein EA89_01056 [Enterococcus faecium]